MVDAALAIKSGKSSGLVNVANIAASNVEAMPTRPVFSLYFDDLPTSVANNPALESSIGDILDRANNEPVYERGAQIFVQALEALGFENTNDILKRVEGRDKVALEVVELVQAL